VEIFNFRLLPVGKVELLRDKNDKPKGCGIVEFECTDSVKTVEKMHRYDLRGRKLAVREVSKHALEQFCLETDSV
jgi:RNA recognition motif-containing protein